FLTYIHRFDRFPHVIFRLGFDSHLPLRVRLYPARERIEVRVSSLSNARNPRNLPLQPWNSRKTRCFLALIRHRELSPLSWAKPARFVFTAGKRTGRQSPRSSRCIRSSGLTATLSISGSKPKNSRAILSTAG